MKESALNARRATLLSGLCAFFAVFLLAWLTGFDNTRRFGWLPAAALLWLGGSLFWRNPDKRLKIAFGLFGSFFMLAMGLGLRLEFHGETGLWGLVASIGLGIAAGPAAGGAAIALFRAMSRLSRPLHLRTGHAFWIVLALLMLCWSPVLVAYFPGITGYDMDFQVYQIVSGNYSSHHPLLHTLFLEAFYRLGAALGSSSLGYGLHTLMQALLLACSIAYAMAWLSSIGCPRGLWIVLLIFFALSPQHAIMAASGTKDILFAACMLTVAVEICRLILEPSRRKRKRVLLADAILIAAACMFRNNAIYGFIALVFVSFLFFRRKLGKRVLAVILAGAVIAEGGMMALSAATGAANGSVRELMSIPCQQLARVYDRYGLSIPVGYEIREVLPDAENYAPDRADFTKRSAKVTTPERMTRFLKLWAREALHFPIEYIDAFLLNTCGFWYVNDFTFATTYDEVEGSYVGCMVLGHNASTGIDAPSLLPGLRALFGELFSRNGYQRFPVLWLLLHPALYTWLLGFVLAWAWYCRNRSALFAGCMLLSYLFTLLMGPCAIIRYQYYLMLAAPVLLGLLCAQARHTPVGKA